MTRSRYIVGIDLGTTNCAVAFVDTKGRERPAADIRMFDVPQLVAPAETAPRTMLPSFLYLTGGPELPPGAAAAAVERRGKPDRRRVRPHSGSQGTQPIGQQCQELALPSRRGPGGRDPALGLAAGDSQGVAGRGLGGIPSAHPGRLEPRLRRRRPDAAGWSSRRWSSRSPPRSTRLLAS